MLYLIRYLRSGDWKCMLIDAADGFQVNPKLMEIVSYCCEARDDYLYFFDQSQFVELVDEELKKGDEWFAWNASQLILTYTVQGMVPIFWVETGDDDDDNEDDTTEKEQFGFEGEISMKLLDPNPRAVLQTVVTGKN